MRWSLRELLLGPTDVGPYTKGIVTLVVMTCTSLAGFLVQQRLIDHYYSGDTLDIHQRVKRIKHRELQEIAARGGEAAADAVPSGRILRGEGALLHMGRKKDD